MNPLTLDFIRRWKWMLGAIFLMTTFGWVSHATEPEARLHLEVFVAMAMFWDLGRGVVRVQLGLPQRREDLAAGLWFSVVGVGVVMHCTAMLLGGALLAPLLGQGMDPGVISLHLVINLLLTGASQFILTRILATPPRTLAGQVMGYFFAILWGLQIFGSFWIAKSAPVSWSEVTRLQSGMMVLSGVLAVASWFMTRGMVMERSVSKPQATPQKAAGDPRSVLGGPNGWRIWVELEVRWLLPTMAGVLVMAVLLISISDYPAGGAVRESREWMDQYRSLGLLCAISVFPVTQLAAASLRACRSLPVPLPLCALVVMMRPFAGGLAVFFVYILLNLVMGRGTGMEGRALAAFLPICSLMSLLQAVILRHPRLPVAFAVLIAFSLVSASVPDVMSLPFPSIGLLGLSAVLLVVSWGLHVRWLGRDSQIYRLNQGFLRMVGGAQR